MIFLYIPLPCKQYPTVTQSLRATMLNWCSIQLKSVGKEKGIFQNYIYEVQLMKI